MKDFRVQRLDLQQLSVRAHLTNSAIPRPFLKWVGSKRLILKYLVDVLPGCFRTYREPFLGSGSLFFLIRPQRAVLSDTCSELIETFEAVRDGKESVLRYLRDLKPQKKLFYEVRQNRSHGRFKRAAQFIFLNKTCWNGLYRVNSQGQFNVPFGAKPPKQIADPINIEHCAEQLQRPGVAVQTCDFEENLSQASIGDLVYLDPPYVTSHNDNGFIEYNERLFSWQDQLRLAEMARVARDRGAHVIVSNANDSRVIRLYKGFNIMQFSRKSTLASDKARRNTVTEVIIFSG